MCGEKLVEAGRISQEEGSPPHVRGKVNSFSAVLNGVGITPACAGKSECRRRWCGSGRDHPRMCGEKDKSHTLPPVCLGSPPHVRGKENLVI